MWRRRQKVYKDPRLYFVNERGEYVTEYLPPANYKVMNWVRDQYIFLRNRLGWDIYYWHFRHNLDPNFRKISDIEFINHVMEDHNQEPEDPIEKRHYNRAWNLYGHEMKLVVQELGKDADTGWDNSELSKGHPYAYAYTRKWFNSNTEAETKTLYHGLKWPDYLETGRMILERQQQRHNEYYKKHGLDPETGKKIPTKKRPKSRLNGQLRNKPEICLTSPEQVEGFIPS